MAQIEYEVWNLSERYGPAAHAIAQSSARQPGGRERRRFWLRVAARLRHAMPAEHALPELAPQRRRPLSRRLLAGRLSLF